MTAIRNAPRAVAKGPGDLPASPSSASVAPVPSTLGKPVCLPGAFVLCITLFVSIGNGSGLFDGYLCNHLTVFSNNEICKVVGCSKWSIPFVFLNKNIAVSIGRFLHARDIRLATCQKRHLWGREDLQRDHTSVEYIPWLHHEFCRRLPEEMLG